MKTPDQNIKRVLERILKFEEENDCYTITQEDKNDLMEALNLYLLEKDEWAEKRKRKLGVWFWVSIVLGTLLLSGIAWFILALLNIHWGA